MPSECLAVLRDAGARFVAGNCERLVLARAAERDSWCLEQLGEEDRALIASWPLTLELEIAGLGDVLFCHATPRSDDEILTVLTPDDAVVDALAGTAANLVVCGHTHVQYDRAVPSAPRLVNAGSVGLPYEGAPGARWALLGPAVDLRTTTYDVESALRRLHEPGFPEVGELFDESLRGQVTAEEASEVFESRRGA
jgi:diadenosine tetraphosphatase ApaH/serine/threonine PP2A family protein phosphatase